MACLIFRKQAYFAGGGVGGERRETNYVSTSQLFKFSIQLENSLEDLRVQFACTTTVNSYPRV